jgi:hypothetical protein
LRCERRIMLLVSTLPAMLAVAIFCGTFVIRRTAKR